MFVISVISMILILIGALNWGLVGFFNYNFISVIFGGSAMGDYSGFDRFVFAIIGLAGIWGLSFLGRLGALCSFSSLSGKKEDDNITIQKEDEKFQNSEEDQKGSKEEEKADDDHKDEDDK